MFLHLSVSHSVHRGGVPGQVPPRADTPLTRQIPTPWAGTPPWQVHPLSRYTPLVSPRQVHPPRRYICLAGTSPGRYPLGSACLRRLCFHTCLSVFLFTWGRGVCLPQCMLGYTPLEQTPPRSRHLPGADTPWEQTPPHWEQTPPPAQCMLGDMGNKWAVHILLECILVTAHNAWLWGVCMVAEACVGYDKIRSMSGRYASYWNAFLFVCVRARVSMWFYFFLNLAKSYFDDPPLLPSNRASWICPWIIVKWRWLGDALNRFRKFDQVRDIYRSIQT